MSYRKRHIKSNVRKIRPRRSIFKKSWFWILILVLVLVSFGVYFSIFYSGVQIKNIAISGNQKVPSEDINELASRSIYKKFLSIGKWDIDSRSIFLVRIDGLKKEILSKFPEIKEIEISRKFFWTLELKIDERTPIAIFCPSLDQTTAPEKGNCYLIDNNGIVFEPLTMSELDILRLSQNECCKISIVRQGWDVIKIDVGQKAIQQNIMDLILGLEKSLRDNFQIGIKEALIKSQTRLDARTNEGWMIYFDTSSDINLQLIKLDLLLSKEISESQRKSLRYINLTPNSKAIICDNPICGE